MDCCHGFKVYWAQDQQREHWCGGGLQKDAILCGLPQESSLESEGFFYRRVKA